MPLTLPIILCSAQKRANEMPVEGDCACADVRASASPARPALQPQSLYQLAPQTKWQWLDDDWSFAFQPYADSGPVALNAAGQQLVSFFQAPQSIAHAHEKWDGAWGAKVVAQSVQRLAESELILPADGVPGKRSFESPRLTVWLHTTNACNLRCAYCYLDKTRDAMSLETGRHALDAVFRVAQRHHYTQVKLKYAGGEAMLNLARICELHAYAARLAEPARLVLDGVVLSNGTLLDENAIAQLHAAQLRLMISLDGIGKYHDAQRAYADGKGSFARVARNIDLAVQRGIVPDISITVSERNLDGLAETIQYVLDRDLPFTLNFYRENDCATSFADLQFSEQRMIDAMLDAYAVIEANLPRRSLVASLLDRTSFRAPHAHTCGVGHDYMVIDQHGRIAKCQMEIQRPVTDIFADDPLQLIRADQIGIQNRSVDEKEGCRECEWRYWCAGGCPLATFRATGRYDVKSPNCNIYKALYPRVLRLEALRLVREYSLGGNIRSVEQ